MAVRRITTRNAAFQQWSALLDNRNKRSRTGQFLVQGVRPITLAVEFGWQIDALLYDADRPLSSWAAELLRDTGGDRYALAADLLAELGEKTSQTPEVIAVVAIPPDDLDRIPVGPGFLAVVFDRPTSPGNIGSLIRSADAFGAHGVIVTGHAADVYDPKAVRATTGSLFAIPVVRAPSHREILHWLADQPTSVLVVGTDEGGEAAIADFDLTRATLLVLGNETAGLSAGWRDACDHTVSIPMTGAASSLNAANAASIVLYEAARQRSRP